MKLELLIGVPIRRANSNYMAFLVISVKLKALKIYKQLKQNWKQQMNRLLQMS